MNSDALPSIAEAARRQFEQAWATGGIPSIESALPPPSDPRFEATLEELIHLDIEFRWRLRARWLEDPMRGELREGPLPLESYARRFPVLGTAAVFARLALSEFEARRRAGLEPQVEEFVAQLTQSELALEALAETVSIGALPMAPAVTQDQAKEVRRVLLANYGPSSDEGTLLPKGDHTFLGGLQPGPLGWLGGAHGADSQLSGYHILERLAEGGMGVVFKARQIGLDRIVALKMIRSGTYASKEEVTRFRREAAAVAQLRHTNIVQIYEIGMNGQQPYFSMEFVEGGSLAKRMNGSPWRSEDAARLLVELSDAVSCAHARNIVHRDLKPANILLARRVLLESEAPSGEDDNISNWIPKITDFGLAKQLNLDQESLTQTEALLGTPCYMSPEQAAGHAAEVGPVSDVYSLGAVLYELLVGRPPFKAATPLETIQLVCTQEPMPPRQINSATAPDLETICLKCLAKEPARRYRDAADLLADLQRYLENKPIHARPVGRLERAVRWCRRNPIIVSLGAAMVSAIVLLCLVLALNQRTTRLTSLDSVTQEFDRRLASPSLAAGYLDEMDRLVSQLRLLSPERATEAQNRLHKRLLDHVENELVRPRLESNAADDIRAVLSTLELWSPGQTRRLRNLLDQRVRQTVFEYESGGKILGIFDATQAASDSHGIQLLTERTESARAARDVLTAADSHGNVELEATFHPDWDHSRRIGLWLHAVPEAGQAMRGYCFELRTTATQRDQPLPTFEAARAANGRVQMVISRDGQALQVRNISALDLVAGSLRLRARREGNRLVLQGNELPQQIHDEVFWSDGRNQGKFGLLWPDKAMVTRLRATRPSSSMAASPLEIGDAIYSAGRFAEALDHFVRQQGQTTDVEVHSELIYKQALCLSALKRGDEAFEFWNKLIQDEGRWSRPAEIQKLNWFIEKGEYANADSVVEGFTTRSDFGELAALVPPSAREKLLGHYCDPVGVYGLLRNPDRIRHLKRALDLQLAVNGELWRISETRFLLMDAYDREGQLSAASEEGMNLLAHPELSAGDRCSVVERMARYLVRQGQPGAALVMIDQNLFSSPGAVVPHHEPMLLTRAALHGSQGEWVEAQEDVELYFNQQLSDKLRNDPRAWLLRGLTAWHCDINLDRAKKYWAEGHRLAMPDLSQQLFPSILLGLISETATAADLMKAIREASGNGFGSHAVEMVRKILVDESEVYAIISSAGKRTRTLIFLERQQCFQLSGEQMIIMAPRIVAHELFTQMITGPSSHARPLSAEEDQLLWDFTQTLYEEYVRGNFQQLHLFPLWTAWKGNKFLGWDVSLKLGLTPPCRGPLAYLMACHFSRLGKTPESQDFLETAARDAPAGSILERLVRERRRIGTMAPLDLQPVANQPVREPLPELGLGDQEFLGVRFRIEDRVIQLAGFGVEDRPKSVEGIKVERKVARLHFLHSVIWSAKTETGAEVGRYEVKYADGKTVTFSLIQGDHLREHWFAGEPQGTVKSGRIAWIGSNDVSRAAGQKLCLCLSSWTNPRPEQTIASLSYVSAMHSTGAAPFCVAITLEEAAAKSAAPPVGTK